MIRLASKQALLSEVMDDTYMSTLDISGWKLKIRLKKVLY